MFSETDSTDLPISPYAASKKAGELLNFHYHKNYDFKIWNLRLFSIYGIRQRPDLVMHQFFTRITHQKPIHVYGLGDSRRDYTYITDVLMAMEAAICGLRQDSQPLYEILNIGNNQPVLLSDLITLMEGIIGKKAIILYHPLPAGDVFATCANIEKAKKRLNYEPKVSLLEGLTHFYDWLNGTKEPIALMVPKK